MCICTGLEKVPINNLTILYTQDKLKITVCDVRPGNYRTLFAYIETAYFNRILRLCTVGIRPYKNAL